MKILAGMLIVIAIILAFLSFAVGMQSVDDGGASYFGNSGDRYRQEDAEDTAIASYGLLIAGGSGFVGMLILGYKTFQDEKTAKTCPKCR